MSHIEVEEEHNRVSRRRFVSVCCMGALMGALSRSTAVLGKGLIAQPGTPADAAFIERAFEMRRLALEYGDQPFGAVVVLDGQIVGQSWSRVLLDHDPTGHAEMSAIRDAGRRLEREDLRGAILYSSSRPCAMCEAAAAWSGIVEMVHGRDVLHGGRPQLCR